MPTFNHYDLHLLNPKFNSELIDAWERLGHLRNHQLRGSTPLSWFIQLKSIFHILESLGSARIEGNHTTLSDYIESKLENSYRTPKEELLEIENIEKAMIYVEKHITANKPINEFLIRELHAMTVNNLVREGDESPGTYRKKSVFISKSDHIPPQSIQIPGYMQELVNFINHADSSKYDLMKVALAHHRFSWIHPFNNGNGRVVRLLTYTMLLNYKFNINIGSSRLLNPTAIFCNDRDKYYSMLARGDTGTDEGLESWCTYVFNGIYEEISKIERLCQYEYVADKILIPAIQFAKEKNLISIDEENILKLSLKRKMFQSKNLDEVLVNLTSRQKTYIIRKLLEQKLICPIEKGARTYTINFSESYLIRGVIKSLAEESFISEKLIKS